MTPPLSAVSDEQVAHSLASQREQLTTLPENWDGYGAKPLPASIVDSMLSEIESEGALVQLVPGGDGSLQAEWHLSGATVAYNIATDGKRSLSVTRFSSALEPEGAMPTVTESVTVAPSPSSSSHVVVPTEAGRGKVSSTRLLSLMIKAARASSHPTSPVPMLGVGITVNEVLQVIAEVFEYRKAQNLAAAPSAGTRTYEDAPASDKPQHPHPASAR